jgi:hypothetical protein
VLDAVRSERAAVFAISWARTSAVSPCTSARVAALAQPSEVLVSRTVRDLVAGSGLVFEDRGLQHLKGVEGDWQLYAVG